MTRFLFFFFFTFQVVGCFCQTTIHGKVVKISDGDTITILEEGNKQTRIRFYGVDCPETGQDFGTVARKFTADHCFKKIVKGKSKGHRPLQTYGEYDNT